MKSTGVGPQLGIADGELLKERKRAVMAWHQDRRTHKKNTSFFSKNSPRHYAKAAWDQIFFWFGENQIQMCEILSFLRLSTQSKFFTCFPLGFPAGFSCCETSVAPPDLTNVTHLVHFSVMNFAPQISWKNIL
jgi:hypothetical protein